MTYYKQTIPIIYEDDTDSENNQKSSTVAKKTHMCQESQVSNTMKIVNTIYSLICCLLSIVLSTTEPFKACGVCGGRMKLIIQGFLIYMYYVSITWICALSIDISLDNRRNKLAIKNQDDVHNRRLASVIRSKESQLNKKVNELNNLINIKQNRHSSLNDSSIQQLNNNFQKNDNNLRLVEIDTDDVFLNTTDEQNIPKYTHDHENGNGELYVRVGTGILSLCTMIDIGLNLVRLLESYSQGSKLIYECKIIFIASVIAELGAFIFTFLQCFFIFKYANIVIHKGKDLASIGLCHLVCTNFSVTLRTIVHRTFAEVSQNNNRMNTQNLLNKTTHVIEKHAAISTSFCTTSDDMTLFHLENNTIEETKESIAPYIFPCAIEYSLLCLTVFYIIWSNLDKKSKIYETRQKRFLTILNKRFYPISDIGHYDNYTTPETADIHSFTIDCSKSATGLFFGILILLMTIISLIVYFIYKHERANLAVEISEITELILVSIALLVTIPAFLKLRRFGYNSSTFTMNYNETLIIIALSGVYMFSFFSLIAVLAQGMHTRSNRLALGIHVLCLIEGTIQSAFILDGLRRCSKDLKTKKLKPARSLITVLIMINLSLWLSETFSVKKYDMNTIQLDYYNLVFWSIVSSIASPLAIFFRFHSSVCLSDIWKTLYQ